MIGLIIGSIPLIIAFIVSIIRYKKLEPKWLRLFAWFFVITFFAQIGGFAYSRLLGKSNHFIFNAYILIENGFYIFVLYMAITGAILKRIALGIGVLFLLFYSCQMFLLADFFVYNPFTKNVGDFLSLICCFLYLTELLMADEAINFFRTPMFWITTGIMITVVGDFLYLAFFNYILQNHLDDHGNVYAIITTTLSVFEFSFFILGFLCRDIWIKIK